MSRGLDLAPGADATLELSPRVLAFLSGLFDQHDAAGEGAIGAPQLASLFTTCPAPATEHEAWARVQVAGSHGHVITKQGFLAKWRCLAHDDPRAAAEQALYLGYALPEFVPGAASPGACARRRSPRKGLAAPPPAAPLPQPCPCR